VVEKVAKAEQIKVIYITVSRAHLSDSGIAGGPVNPNLLLQKLIEIERSIGIETDSTIRHKVLEAEECLLRMQGQRVEQLRAQAATNDSERFSLLRALSQRKASQTEF